jgi:hypothetical protein
MISRRALILSSTALLIAGCATVPPPQLSNAEISSYKITEVAIRGDERIRSWPTEHEAYISEMRLPPKDANRIRNVTYDGHPALRERFVETIKRVHLVSLQSFFLGSRPARAIVNVKSFHVPGMASRIFVSSNAIYFAGIEIQDLTTGKVILSFEGRPISVRMFGGVTAPLFDAATLYSIDHGRNMNRTGFAGGLNS